MALNKFMHSRNIYRTPPDFGKLAKCFEEFSSISKLDIAGKVTIDFKDPRALRVLTQCLLKSDFGLDVFIPENRLVPTLPLRLNYILWIEDLMSACNRKDNVKGLDIGTGACAIYPLLAAAKNKWQMVGTETDQESFLKAKENVHRNNLQEFVKLIKNQTETLLAHLLSDDTVASFDFCMCNPPFYSNVQELCESRSPARLPPKNGFTGSPQELITEGGELVFCRKMIKESQQFKDRILIFTTMVGHKCNMRELVQDLKAENIEHTSSEFCQGRVTRWGIAWTFQALEISKLVPGRDNARKKNIPIVHVLPKLPGLSHDIELITKKLLTILQGLKINYKLLNKRGNNLSFDITAAENTWSNQRKKRRLMKLQQQDEAKKHKMNESKDATDPSINTDGINVHAIHTHAGESNKTVPNDSSQISQMVLDSDLQIRTDESADCSNNEKLKCSSTATEIFMQANDQVDCGTEYSGVNLSMEVQYLVHAFFKILKKDQDILLEMEFLDGTAGKEGVHQIMQYIKNNWK